MALVPSRQTKMIEPNQMKSFSRNRPLLSELKWSQTPKATMPSSTPGETIFESSRVTGS